MNHDNVRPQRLHRDINNMRSEKCDGTVVEVVFIQRCTYVFFLHLLQVIRRLSDSRLFFSQLIRHRLGTIDRRAGDHTHASARDRHIRPSHLSPAAAAALLNIHKRVIVAAAAYALAVCYAFLIGFSLVTISPPHTPSQHDRLYILYG